MENLKDLQAYLYQTIKSIACHSDYIIAEDISESELAGYEDLVKSLSSFGTKPILKNSSSKIMSVGQSKPKNNLKLSKEDNPINSVKIMSVGQSKSKDKLKLSKEDNPINSAKIMSVGQSKPKNNLKLSKEDNSINSAKKLAELQFITKDCDRCSLCEGRTKLVFGEGYIKSNLMFIGEGPGKDEDLSGQPFVGRSGKLLRAMINTLGMSADSIYITNVVKCRPPNNRSPSTVEVEACRLILLNQIRLIEPKLIILVGKTALNHFFPEFSSMAEARQKVLTWHNHKLFAIFHPAYILRSRTKLNDVWQDFRVILDYIEEHKQDFK
ncbi:MAG: uracil-DNA glycosylase [SAR324 cluster bacterium]|nr:uracil-DNA glycosylase [SAR324 cluster bacterium]